MYNEQMTSINNHPLKLLTLEEYERNKSNDRFVHEIAWAHGVEGWDNFHLAMCFYVNGTEYYVSRELQGIAKAEYDRRKKNIVDNIGNKLVFVGMGMDFVPSTPEYVGNHRIRTYFKNNEGLVCFVEFTAAMDNKFLCCPHGTIYTRDKPSEWESLEQREATEHRIKIEGIQGHRYTKEDKSERMVF